MDNEEREMQIRGDKSKSWMNGEERVKKPEEIRNSNYLIPGRIKEEKRKNHQWVVQPNSEEMKKLNGEGIELYINIVEFSWREGSW